MAHLLLKNTVADAIGGSGYALITEATTEALDIPIAGSLPHAEQYEHYPLIRGYVFPL